ncbi:MAG: patatin-like phospholipase family protein [Bryobacteraceae bacterium]
MIQPNQYCAIAVLVAYLLRERQTHPDMKLAFAFEGGGAKGCYHGGLLEGIAQQLAPHGGLAALRPDILTGTSVGAIAAFGLWMDMVYPGRPAGSRHPGLRDQ